MEQKEFKVGQVWRRRGGGTETIRAVRTNAAPYPIIGRVTTYTREGKCFACEDSSIDLVELIQDVAAEPVPRLESSPHETLSAAARAAIEAAIVELRGQAAHAADERDTALARYEEAATRQREKELAAIELGALLVRMPESTD